MPPALFITGTDTDVGKTYVGALIARSLHAAGHRVGAYKPAASGCRREGAELISDDALALWQAAGGLLAPLDDEECFADLAYDFGFPLVIVAKNALGTINHTLLTLQAAKTFRGGLPVAGVVLNHPVPPNPNDPSLAANRRELEIRCRVPILGEVFWQADKIDAEVDWLALANDDGRVGRRFNRPT